MNAKGPPRLTKLQIEPIDRCNLRCRMCMLPYEERRRARRLGDRREPAAPRFISADVFHRVLDQARGVAEIHLQGLGEPLLHPEFVQLVRGAAQTGALVSTNTNLTLLDGEQAAALLDAGLRVMHASIDAASPRLYEEIRPGARFGRVEEALASVAELRARRRSVPDAQADPRSFRLNLVAVLMRRNLEELPGLVRLAARYRADGLSVQRLIRDFDEERMDTTYAGMRAFVEEEVLRPEDLDRAPLVFAETRALAAELGLGLRLPRLPDTSAPDKRADTRAGGHCDWPRRGLYVTAAGEILPCCAGAVPDSFRLGSVERRSLREVWEGGDLQALRDALESGNPPDVCRACALYRGEF